jgi:hypothetical protein
MRFLAITITLLTLILASCSSEKYRFPQADIHIEETESITIHRYGKALFELDTANLPDGLKRIRNEFPLFLDADLEDTSNVNQLYNYVTDTQLRQIYTGVMEVFPDVIKVESSLTEAFARQKYFYPGNHSYNVYTYISDLYYESPVIISEKDMVIAIDVYLGKDYPLYMHLGLPLYKIRCMEPANLPIDVMKAIYFEDVMTPSRPRTLLDRMIGGGKLLAYLDAVLPEADDTLKICYSGSKLRWAEENERNVWAFLVQNELLYATDYQIQTKMIQDGPFTTGFTDRSPSRLGIYLGWQIVRTYLHNNPDLSLQEVLAETDSQKILNGSGYRP